MSAESRQQRALYEARRHLASIGVQTQFTARGDALKGAMDFPGDQALRNPAGGAPISRIRFTVAGDGSFRIDDPPGLAEVSGLPSAGRLASVEVLAAAIRKGMDRTFSDLRGLASRLRGLGLRVENDASRMVLLAHVDLERLGVVTLEGDARGVVARELQCTDGTRHALPEIAIDLDQYPDRIDLELFLAGEVERLVPERARKADVVVSGHDAVRSANPELFVDLTEQVTELVAGMTPPLEGETWVMDVIVESDDGEEVRYRGVGFTGQAFGAPRVLPKIAFEKAYTRSGQTWRMLVQVTHVDEENVGYVMLDSERRPTGGERKVALVGFLANFTLEPALG